MSELRPSICRVCANFCSVLVEVEDGIATRVTGDRDNPVYEGYTCVKGRAQAEMLHHPERFLHSQKRQPDGTLAPIPFEDALDEIAEQLRRIIDRDGARAFASYWGTAQISSAVTNPMWSAFMSAIGSPMRFSSSTIDKPGKYIAKRLIGTWMAPHQSFDRADVGLIIGANPFVTYHGLPTGHPANWLARAAACGFKLIVIDPRRSDAAKRAFLHLQPRPGEDVALVAAMIRVILCEGLHDRAFVDEHVSGVDDLARAVARFDPAQVARRADVDVDDLVHAARVFARGPRGYAFAGTGPNMSGPGTLLEYLVQSLDTICGHWMRAGEQVHNPGVLVPTFSAKAQALPPGPAWGFGEQLRVRGLRDTADGLPTSALAEEMLLEGPGRVRAFLCVAGNPVAAWPDQRLTIQALRSLELLVQVDPWPSQTAELAHYVLAPKLPLEMESSSLYTDYMAQIAPGYGTIEPWGQHTPAIVDPPPGAEVVEDWEVFFGLAARLGLQLRLGGDVIRSFDVEGAPISGVALDMQCTPRTEDLLELLSAGSRVPLAEVKQHPRGAVFTEPRVVVAPKDPGWTGRLDVGNEHLLRDLDGIETEAAPVDTPDFPFRLLCRRTMHMYNSSGNRPPLNRGRAWNPARMHPDDMRGLGVVGGDLVEITSRARRCAPSSNPMRPCAVASCRCRTRSATHPTSRRAGPAARMRGASSASPTTSTATRGSHA